MTSILTRPITSYAKVQALLGHAFRNRTWQVRRERARSLRYLDIGCGLNAHSNFVNLDYRWHPGIDVCWDIRHGLPFSTASMKGVFSEHCLEHFSIPKGILLIGELRRVLRHDGVLRIVVPDAERYLRTYVRQTDGDSSAIFPFQETAPICGIESPILHVNRVFYQDRESPYGHQVMYDFSLLRELLLSRGFSWVERASFRQGRDPVLLIDSADRESESLYLEAGG